MLLFLIRIKRREVDVRSESGVGSELIQYDLPGFGISGEQPNQYLPRKVLLGNPPEELEEVLEVCRLG